MMPDWLKNLWGGNQQATSGVPMGATWTPSFEGISSYGAPAPTGPSMSSSSGFSLAGTQAPAYTNTGWDSGFGNMPAAPAASGGLKGWFSNGQNLGTAIQGFGSLAQAYLGFQAMKQAKEGLKFQKEAFNANLGNSIKSYNTQLEDRINGRTSAYEGKERDVSAYLAKHQLTR
jgi:hypothetical protein